MRRLFASNNVSVHVSSRYFTAKTASFASFEIASLTRPSRIKESVEDWRTLHPLYDQLAPIITSLDLTHEGLRYYANAVLKAQVFRSRGGRRRTVICTSSALSPTSFTVSKTPSPVLTVVQTVLNTCKRIHKEHYYEARLDYSQAVGQFWECVGSGVVRPLETIETLAFRPDLTAQEKVERIQAVSLLRAPAPRGGAKPQLATFHTQVHRDATGRRLL